MIATPIIVLSILLICWGISKIMGNEEDAQEFEQAAEDYKKRTESGCGCCGCFTWLFIIMVGGAIIGIFR